VPAPFFNSPLGSAKPQALFACGFALGARWCYGDDFCFFFGATGFVAPFAAAISGGSSVRP